jgi:membrane protease YdiL (CAAX protease family)
VPVDTVAMISRWIAAAPWVSFTVVAYLLSWWPALLPGGGLLPYGPAMAAVIVIGLTAGRAGLRAWVAPLMTMGRGARWYAWAVLIPAGLAFAAAGLTVAGGAPAPSIDWWDPVMVLPVMLVVGGMWEEPGWTGYALPRLVERFGTTPPGILGATAAMAVIRAGWHLPLILTGVLPWIELVFIVALQVVLSWLYFAGGSLWPVMLAHLTSNTVGGAFVETWFSGEDQAANAVLRAVVWGVLALALVLGTRGRLGHHTTSDTAQSTRDRQRP